VWDVVLDAPSTIVQADMDSVRDLESKLKEIDVDGARLRKVLSIADVEDALADLPLLSLASPEARLAPKESCESCSAAMNSCRLISRTSSSRVSEALLVIMLCRKAKLNRRYRDLRVTMF
jgi:hypothetical protein